MPVAAADDPPRANLVGLHAVAVEFHFVLRGGSGRHALGRHRAAGWCDLTAEQTQRLEALACLLLPAQNLPPEAQTTAVAPLRRSRHPAMPVNSRLYPPSYNLRRCRRGLAWRGGHFVCRMFG